MQSVPLLIGLLKIYWCSSPGLSLYHVPFFFTALTLCLFWKTTIIEARSEHLSFFDAQNGLRIWGQTTVASSRDTNCATNWNSPHLGWEIALSYSKQCLRGPNENLHQDLTASITTILKACICSLDSRFFARVRNNSPVKTRKAMFYLVPHIKQLINIITLSDWDEMPNWSFTYSHFSDTLSDMFVINMHRHVKGGCLLWLPCRWHTIMCLDIFRPVLSQTNYHPAIL